MSKIRVLMIALALAVVSIPALARVPRSIRAIVLSELRQHPKMEVQDLYKLVLQAAMGNEHVMTDAKELRKDLDDELATAEMAGDEPEVQPLVSDSSLVRINLRAFKAHKKDAGALIEAMLKTAAMFQQNPAVFRMYWNEVEALATDKLIPFKISDLHAFFTRMEGQGFPAVHHSKAYEDAYHPAYRVILRDAL